MRSASAPDTIVAAVPANIIWNATNAQPAPSSYLMSVSPNVDQPTMPPMSSPKMNEKPNSTNTIAAMSMSARFLMPTLIEFFARENPASTAVKPACMKNTSVPQISIQPMSMFVCIVSSAACVDSFIRAS